ncbi:MAG: ferredoxin--nitrite reductase, partial [Synechococcus sp. SB0664_bin_36]|nr:ferredoxin--nitrite reductase [Synechococcus sp. SB0664_bin_36]
MQPGDRVRVRKSVIVYNHPKHRSKPFDIHGQE